jgi:hypothetical protein
MVLVEIRKRFCWRYYVQMARGNGIVVELSILLIKVISGEMTGFLE